MSDDRFVPEIIKLPGILIRFARLYTPQARTNRDGSSKMRKEKDGRMVPDTRFQLTGLLDPSNEVHAAKIKEVKAEAKRCLLHRYKDESKFPKTNPATGLGGLIMPFGNGNDLPKVYEGFQDMFYIKLSDKNRPLLWDRRHNPVAEGDEQAPYDGAICNVSGTFWSYDNESRGVGVNLREVQFVKDGKHFDGGGGNRGGDFEPLENGEDGAPAAGGKDPWDD